MSSLNKIIYFGAIAVLFVLLGYQNAEIQSLNDDIVSFNKTIGLIVENMGKQGTLNDNQSKFNSMVMTHLGVK